VDVSEISGPLEIDNLELRERAQVSTKNQYTKHYVVKEGAQEVAFLSLDLYPGTEYLALYELFVAASERRKGVGSKVLGHAEDLGRNLGYRIITVTPWPLEPEGSEEDLLAWYRARGYSARADVPDEFEKKL
jgi:GNAT superfamily N-acetyltransferase